MAYEDEHAEPAAILGAVNAAILATMNDAHGALSPESQDCAGLLGHRERDTAVVLGERVRVEVRVDLLRDRDAGVAEKMSPPDARKSPAKVWRRSWRRNFFERPARSTAALNG
jgi:broad specificity phosphatase PhoE